MENLRQRALELLNKDPGKLAEMKPQDLKALLHELRAHQIELETQNQELREARQELEQTQLEYAGLYDYAPVGYLSLGLDGRIGRLNLIAADLLGKPRQELLGTLLSHYIADADRASFQQEIRLAMKSRKRHACDLRLQRPDGLTHVHFECQMATLETTRPGILRVALIDISKRIKAEEQLRISRRQLEEALEASQCGLWDWPDVERDEAWWSPEFYRLLGYEDGDLKPGYDSFRNLLHPKDREQVLKALEGCIRAGQAFDMEFRLRTRDGEYRWFHGHGQIINYELDGRHMAGLIQDVTEKHEIDATLRRAKDKAEQADREKSQFLAAASHDLRQPLQSLSLYLSTLKQLPLSVEAEGIIYKMRQSVRTMGQLLRTLLNVSRLDAGVIEPEPAVFSARELFSDILVTNGPAAEAKDLVLRIHSCGCRLYSDRVLLQEIVQNFVSNALRNTDSGGVLIGCRHRGGKALIQVWDTGIGIPPEKLPELLDPQAATFSRREARADNTIRPGLGLAIVRQISGLLNHRVDAVSVPGRGSMFSVEVPVATTGASAQDHSSVLVVRDPSHDGRLSLLLVDNDTAILDACRAAAAAAGHRLTCASTAAEALALVADGLRPDAIITDLRLRRVPGTEVIHRMRKSLGEITPAILLTGDTSSYTEVQALTRCRVLYKPVEFDVLVQTIEELLPGD